ncbi:MAG: SusD/RagB family nutrient-binding outer membrane lipoprotein [Gemmatimonadota bacterium]|nr:SusD/RagB family nutrient-binding outer membrane lipoprotein [Gemmatimonadota bacterium]
MMNRNRWLLVGAGIALIGAAGCDNNKLTSLNNNPNSPTDVPAKTVFTNAAQASAGRWIGNGYDLRGTEWVAQHLAEVQYPDEDDYKRLQGGQTAGIFDGAYQGELEDLRQVVKKGQAANDPGTWAPAMILQVWDFSFLTDTWGDVPYSQALSGDSTGGTLTPAYDAQKDIYAGLFAQLDQASKALSGASNNLGSADPIYGGDPAMWQKFANSLRARLALRVVNVDPALANTQLTAAFSAPGGVFKSNADAAKIAWPGDGVFNNPWSGNFSTRDDHRMSQTLMHILFANNDPRVPIYAQPTVNDTTVSAMFPNYAGMPNGLTQATASVYFNNTSRPGVIFYPGATTYGTFGDGSGKSTPSYYMTYADVAFIQAEAANRSLGGLTPGQAAGFYTAGITASMNQWGVATGDVVTYLAQPSVAYQGGLAGLNQIDLQRWVALYGDGGQAWAEWRRTCVPNTVKPGPYAIINTVPRRFEYSITEYSVNATQVAAAVARQGPDVFQTSMWWDKATAAPTYTSGCGVRQ